MRRLMIKSMDMIGGSNHGDGDGLKSSDEILGKSSAFVRIFRPKSYLLADVITDSN